jgi:hypothetical protein
MLQIGRNRAPAYPSIPREIRDPPLGLLPAKPATAAQAAIDMREDTSWKRN